ncbi:MAG TPA: NUDIX domain-containing protein [Candidatus Paceibacterota bacterium]
MEYKNPIPVVVGIILPQEYKVLTIKRAIEPHIGGLALPGGYIEEGDNWRKRLRMEIEEEACVVVSTRPNHMRLYDARTTPDGKHLLLFAVVTRDGIEKFHDFVPNAEVSERHLSRLDLHTCPSLCFNLHEEVLRQYRDDYWVHARRHLGG